MARTVAVTGASGSLGMVLLDRLIADPDVARIVAIDRNPLPYDHPRVSFARCDIREAALGDHLQGCDALVHLAFIVERGSRDAELVQSVNVDGSRNAITAAARAGLEQIVYASSIAAYGFHPDNAGGPLTEDAPIRGNPDFYYARTKAEVEHWLDDFEREHPSIAIARLRPSIFLGPRGHRDLALLRSRVMVYLTGRDNPVHVTHEHDVAAAFHLALHERARGAFNIATDEPLPVCQWPRHLGRPGVPLPSAALALADLAYRAGLSDVDPVWLRSGAEHPIVVSSKKARQVLRWRPVYDTTGAVLRALAERPGAAASRGVKLLFGGASAITRARGRLPVGDGERDELRGINGTVNLSFTGDTPSEWHISIRHGVVGFYPGLDPTADATIAMREAAFYQMLSGELTHARATMTGRMRLRGEGNWGLLVGGIVGGFRSMGKAPGWRGLPMRAFANLVLRSAPQPAAEQRGGRA